MSGFDYRNFESDFIWINDLFVKYKLPYGFKINNIEREYLKNCITEGFISGRFSNGKGWWIITKNQPRKKDESKR